MIQNVQLKNLPYKGFVIRMWHAQHHHLRLIHNAIPTLKGYIVKNTYHMFAHNSTAIVNHLIVQHSDLLLLLLAVLLLPLTL